MVWWGVPGAEVAFHLSGNRSLKKYQEEGQGTRPVGGPGRAAGGRQVMHKRAGS